MKNKLTNNLQDKAWSIASNREPGEEPGNEEYDALKRIQNGIRQIAPEPGTIVLIHTQVIQRPDSTFDSVLLSAMDACTQLQLARFYFVFSLAATIDFLEYIVKTFPFPIAELRADHSHLLVSGTAGQVEHRFTLAADRIGVRHSIGDMQGDGVESNLLRYFFETDGRTRGTQEEDEALLADLQRFLFLHNNCRSLPTLDGKTPIDKLRSFGSHRSLEPFDP